MEKHFERQLIHELKEIGVFAIHLDAVGCDGWPDILCLMGKDFCLVECKYGTLHLRKEQYAFHEMLRRSFNVEMVLVASRMEGYYTLGSLRLESVSEVAKAIRMFMRKDS